MNLFYITFEIYIVELTILFTKYIIMHNILNLTDYKILKIRQADFLCVNVNV